MSKRKSPAELTSRLRETIVTAPEHLAECCSALEPHTVIGFDTEFIGEESYHPLLCLLQIAVADHLFLVDPLALPDLTPLWKLLTDPKRTIVVHAGREELRLGRRHGGGLLGNVFDVQIAAGLVGYGHPLSHANLISAVCHKSVPKGETLSDWRRRPLSKEQIRYAFDDVRFLLQIHSHINERLERLKRVEWANEEFRVFVTNSLRDTPPLEKWRKLRGAGNLDRRRLAIVRELCAWREEQAARSDRPSRVILRDDLIIETAKRNPKKEKDLRAIRGMDRGDAPHLFELVEKAQGLPLELCPEVQDRESDPPQVGLVAGLLTAVLTDFCAREELAPSLVATQSDLKTLVRSRLTPSPDDDCALMRGWRKDHVLPTLLDVLDGRRTFHIGNLTSDWPLVLSDRARREEPS